MFGDHFTESATPGPGYRLFAAALPLSGSWTCIYDMYRKSSGVPSEAWASCGINGNNSYWDDNHYSLSDSNTMWVRYATSDGESSVAMSHTQNAWRRCWIRCNGSGIKYGIGSISGTTLTTEWETAYHPLNGSTMAGPLSIGAQVKWSSVSSPSTWSYPADFDTGASTGTWVRNVNTFTSTLTDSEIAARALPTSAP